MKSFIPIICCIITSVLAEFSSPTRAHGSLAVRLEEKGVIQRRQASAAVCPPRCGGRQPTNTWPPRAKPPNAKPPKGPPNEPWLKELVGYIVRYPPGTPDSVKTQAKEIIKQGGGRIGYDYKTVVNGFSAYIPKDLVEKVKKLGNATLMKDMTSHGV